MIEYRNAGFYNVDPTTNDTVSFQIVFEQGVSNKVWVYFQTARGRGEGADATLGAQTNGRTLQYACFNENSAYAGLALTYSFGLGTNPHVGDWDGDGSLDGAEAAWWVAAAPLPWFNVSGGTSVLYSVNSGYGLIPAKLPFPVWIGGAVCTNALLDINGVVYFIDRLKSVDSRLYSRDSNSVLTNSQPLTDNHFAVTAHWDDLYARSATPATRITVADVSTNGARYCVIEYRDMGFYTNSSARISFQIVLPESETNTVYVRYADTAGANTGGTATLGAQGPGAAINIPVSFNRPFITNGLTLAYHFGSGGSPFVKDTDGDGLEDGAEAALGTSPANTDSDGDGLPDKWETDNTLDPLSAAGDDGADGDPDGDGLLNRDEFEHVADPQNADKDEDGLTDLEEVGGVTPADIPWFDLSGGENITPLFSNLDYSCLTVPLVAPAYIRGAVFTNLTLDINGLVYLNPTGYQNSAYSSDWHDDMADWTVNGETLTLAPFWANLIAVTNTAPASQILSGTATDGTNLYRVIEYRNMRINAWPVSTNNMVSFQLAIPTGATDRVFVRYALASGTADGRVASVGLQGLGGDQKDSWCFDQAGRVRPGLSLTLVIGTGSNPQKKDTDSDGLEDAEEIALGTDPADPDTDNDQMSDGWEWDNGFNPLVNNSTDGDPDNDAGADPDGDGLTNSGESDLWTDPFNPDSDGDGVTDGGEAGQGRDPLDPEDTPSAEWIELTGDLDEGEVKTRDLTLTIPAGQSRLIVVALQSDEYPEYTGDSSEFNDILTWNVTPASGTPISGSADVNSRHTAWVNGIALNGYDPVCVEELRTFTAPAGTPMTVTVHLTAKNVSDGILPSTVMVGVLNLDIDGDVEEDGDIDSDDDKAEGTLPLVVAVNGDTRELIIRRFDLDGVGTLKIAKSGSGKITLKKQSGSVVLGENSAESADILDDVKSADLTLILDGTEVGDVVIALQFSSDAFTCSVPFKVKVVKSDVIIRKGDGVIAWLIGEDATHSGIDWGPLVTDIYNPGIEQITLTEFENYATDQTKGVRLRLNKELFMARRVWAKVYDNMSGQTYSLPSDAKPWNLFTTALDYNTANCNEFVRGQFRKAVADVYAELTLQEQRDAFVAAYYDGSTVRPLIEPRHLKLFLGPPEISVGLVNGMVTAEELYSQTHGVSDSFQHVFEGEVVDFWFVPLTGNRHDSGHGCAVCGRYPALRWYLLPGAELMAEAHHSTITPAAIIDSTFFETIPYGGE